MPFPVELYTSQLWVIIKKHVQTPPEEKMRFASKPQQTLKEIAVKKISFRHNNSNWHVQAKHSSWPLTGLEALCTLRSLLQWSKCKNPTQEFTERKRRKTASDNLSTLYQIWNRLWEDYQSLFPLSLPSLKFYTMQYSRPTVLKINIDIDGSSNLYSLGYTHGIHSVTRPHE